MSASHSIQLESRAASAVLPAVGCGLPVQPAGYFYGYWFSYGLA